PHEEPPVDLDEFEADWHRFLDEWQELGDPALDVVPDLVAELRDARAEIERLRGLPTRQEYALAAGGKQHPDACAEMHFTTAPGTADTWAAAAAKDPAVTAWVRD